MEFDTNILNIEIVPSAEDLANARANEYSDNRGAIFGQQLKIGEQLDMLYHELESTGTISTNGEWFNAVKAVKDKYPKPENN